MTFQSTVYRRLNPHTVEVLKICVECVRDYFFTHKIYIYKGREGKGMASLVEELGPLWRLN